MPLLHEGADKKLASFLFSLKGSKK